MNPSSAFQGRNVNPPKLFDEINKGCKECRFSGSKLFDDDGMMLMGPVISHAYSPCSCCPNLLQNCDLPPPVKVFTGVDKVVKPKYISKINPEESGELPISKNAQESDKLELMKALQLSQSRARTAEKKASLMTEERDRLYNLFLKESLRLFAHRQWLQLLQLEVSHLQSHKQKKQTQSEENHDSKTEAEKGSPGAEESENASSLTWYMTLAICLGIAGVGIAVGYRYMF